MAELKIAMLQFAPALDQRENLIQVSKLIDEAATAGAQLILLPEYSNIFAKNFADISPVLNDSSAQEWLSEIKLLSLKHGVSIVLGMLHPDSNSGKFKNQVFAVQSGEIKAKYEKVHLYDAYGARESDWIRKSRPKEVELLQVAGLRIGFISCYDLRFPESARVAAIAGTDVLVVPAQWVPGPNKKRAWQTLLAARAIENQIFVLGIDQAAPNAIGFSSAYDPNGIKIASAKESPVSLEIGIDLNAITRSRKNGLFLEQRRFSLEPRFFEKS